MRKTVTKAKVTTRPAKTAKATKKTTAAAPGAKFAEALALWPGLCEEVGILLGVPAHEAAHIRASAIMEGLKPLLLDGGRSTANADDREFTAQKIMVLLDLLEEGIPPAAKDGPSWSASIDPATLFRDMERGIATMRSLVSGYLPTDHAAIASPGASSQAGEASYSDWCCDISYRLDHAAFEAKAARALLRENNAVDSDEGLTGVSYMLSRIAEDVGAMAAEVSNSEFIYTLPGGRSADTAAT